MSGYLKLVTIEFVTWTWCVFLNSEMRQATTAEEKIRVFDNSRGTKGDGTEFKAVLHDQKMKRTCFLES